MIKNANKELIETAARAMRLMRSSKRENDC